MDMTMEVEELANYVAKLVLIEWGGATADETAHMPPPPPPPTTTT